MVKLGLDSSEFTKGTQQAKNQTKGFVDDIGGMFTKLAASITILAALKKAFDFSKESYQVAAQAEGVERAFAKLNRPDLLNQLRDATRGTVSDLELMQNAIQAKNFKIPLENLATYLKFANQRAKDTGQSVDYLVQSIVIGVGRKSPLILDNLGISALEVREEFAKTGDMAKAVANIIDREMGNANSTLDGSKEKIARVSVAWENLKKSAGQTGWMKAVGDVWNETLSYILNSFTALNESKTLNWFERLLGYLGHAGSQFKALQEQQNNNANNKRIENDVNGMMQYIKTIDQAKSMIASIDKGKDGPFGMSEFNKTYRQRLVDYITQNEAIAAENERLRNTREGLERELSGKKELLQSAKMGSPEEAKLIREIAALERKLQVKKEVEKAGAKGSISYAENELAKLEQKIKFVVTDDERAELQTQIDELRVAIKVKLGMVDDNDLKKIGNIINQEFSSSNADLLARPLIDAAKLVENGWKDAGEGIATVYSSQFGVLDDKGNVVEILVTPILPDGTVLSPEELEGYIAQNLESVSNILESDNMNIVLGVNVDPDGSAGERLHELQELYYGIVQGIQANSTYEIGSIANIDALIAEQENLLNVLNLTEQEITDIQDKINDLKTQRAGNLQRLFPVGSAAAYAQEIALLDENMSNLTGAELDAALAARSFAEIMQQGASIGWKTQLEQEIDYLNTLKEALKSATEDRRAFIQEQINAQQAVVDSYDKNKVALKNFNDDFVQLLENGAIAGLSALGAAIGELALGHPEDAWKIFLNPIADMAIQLGELAIATGITMAGIKAAFKSMNPYAAIAAGVALVALGTFVKGQIGKIGGDGSGTGTNPDTFSGGYSYSGSERANMNALQIAKPEPQVVVLETRVRGSDIILATDKERTRRRS